MNATVPTPAPAPVTPYVAVPYEVRKASYEAFMAAEAAREASIR
jgi:hypothetical protein